MLKQGGIEREYRCDARGMVEVELSLDLEGEIVLHASHHDARIGYEHIDPHAPPTSLQIDLFRFDRSDNIDYPFWAPGSPKDLLNCAHCHHKMNRDWYGSPHRHAASNPTVQDLYAGVVSAITEQAVCEKAGGEWRWGRKPGSSEREERCYLGAGALPDLNPDCAKRGDCDDSAQDFGGCADCHAPGINGNIGGRNLLDATGAAYDSGVHCDVCHKVESINPDKAPGVAGYLKILRPSEPPSIPGELYEPLIFGPFRDVSQIQMGAVYRDHFQQAEFCAGCHDYGVQVRKDWGPLDQEKWPVAKLPIQSTFNEWKQGPYAPKRTCMKCHMPADPLADNAAGLEDSIASGPSQIAGWIRPRGSVRKHSWIGPRTPSSGLLESAATLGIEAQVQGDRLEVQVKVTNAAAGHAIPTGLPTRSMILVVRSFCDQREQALLGGDVVPDFGGSYQEKRAGQDWTRWPNAKVGQVIRVARFSGERLRGDAVAHFGEKSAPRKALEGIERLDWRGQSKILAVDGQGLLSLDKPLSAGDVAFLGDALDLEAAAPLRLAGTAGFAFARVMKDKQGQINVPSFRAVDIRSDNRIVPRSSWTSRHQFELLCAEPRVEAKLLYRSFPPSWVQERGWDRPDRVIKSRSVQLPGR